MSNLIKREAPDSSPVANIAREYGLGILKGVIGAIPHIGSLLNELAFEARSRLKQQRLEAFFTDLGTAVAQLSEEKISHEYLQSEEFSDLFEDVAVKVAQTRDERKREYFKNILLKGITGQRTPDLSATYLALLREITMDEIAVLSKYVEAHHQLKERAANGHPAEISPIDYDLPTQGGYPIAVYRQLIQSLLGKGLLFDDSFGRYDTPAFTCVAATDFGVNFLSWLQTEGR